MAPHSSVLAWRIPGTGEPSGLPSMGSHRVGQRLSSSSSDIPVYVCTTSSLSIHPSVDIEVASMSWLL